MSEIATRPPSTTSQGLGELLRSYSALLGMIVVFLIVGYFRPSFLHLANIENVLKQSAILIIMALGLTTVFILRGVDLSLAQITDAAGILAGGLLLQGEPTWLAFAAPLALGVALGGVNGVLTAYVGIPAIICTLGTMFIIRSGEMVYTHGNNPLILFTLPAQVKDSFLFLGQKTVGPFPALIVLAIVVFLAAYVLQTLTPFGRLARAVGSNIRAAYLAGVDTRRVFCAGFVVSGLLGAIAGVAMVSRTGIAMPHGAEPYLLDAFAAAYVGTLASRTGAMTIPGSLVGALFISFLGNGLTLLGLGAPFRFVLNGGFILLAMAIGGLRRPRAD
jgi:ribose/xylose/arabinose/galactoside ABC-type transport system permease subunit